MKPFYVCKDNKYNASAFLYCVSTEAVHCAYIACHPSQPGKCLSLVSNLISLRLQARLLNFTDYILERLER